MKIFHFLFLSLLHFTTLAQWNEDFNDGDFNHFPIWSGETNKFIIENGRLRLYDETSSSSAWLQTSSSTISGSWEFTLDMAFNPSSSNYAEVVIASNSGTGKEYFLRVGSVRDDISLWYKEGQRESIIIEGIEDRLDMSSVFVRIRVSREGCNWLLESLLPGETDFIPEGNGCHRASFASDFFIIRCFFTSTRKDKFYFDDIVVDGEPFRDLQPPGIRYFAVEEEQLRLEFTEPVIGGLESENYLLLPGQVSPNRVSLSEDQYILNFGGNMQAGESYQLQVRNLSDTSFNTLDTLFHFRYLPPVRLEAGDVIISEVMPDPDAMGAEFLELFNNSEKFIDISWLTLIYNDRKYSLAGDYWLAPGQYFGISEDTASVRRAHPVSSGVLYQSELPQLRNSEGMVLLKRDTLQLDSIQYNEDLHFPLLRDTRGISLERLDPDIDGMRPDNWTSASSVAGYATPGSVNSHFRKGPIQWEGALNVDPPVMLPGNTGFQDILTISFDLGPGTWMVTLRLFSLDGRLEHTLLNNELREGAGSLYWNGFDNEGIKPVLGIHVLILDAFNDKGETKILRQLVVIGPS